ncbi:heme NO-binding domain-containing protein [Congregibacter litoralis]|uniref:Heme NO binding protein n=1 Tax=Congregibacter litoralis KT71 TaxID=314285 RepID=A4AB82_9GAMM|nr:heme NO-binding domain-containing protein [Congregibacter litoralis]EAQ96636.1 Heme NO binding protein [Congregibacter litoralis KT71]
MYGLINSALQDMVVTHFGEEQWKKVHQRSGVAEDSYLTMRRYDDESTYQLAAAASEVLEAPIDTCMEMFGKHWVDAIAIKHYASLMDATGIDTVGFLHNLNSLHDRIASTFLDYVPPEFRVEDSDKDAGKHFVHYYSERKGLTSFVTGLLGGLAEHFGDKLEIVAVSIDDDGEGTHSVFELSIQ